MDTERYFLGSVFQLRMRVHKFVCASMCLCVSMNGFVCACKDVNCVCVRRGRRGERVCLKRRKVN